MPSASKAKGNNWERQIAKYLGDLYQLPFIRVPHSGAYIGGSNNTRRSALDSAQYRSFKGDIVPPENWTQFNAEAKSYKDFPFHQLFQGNVKILDQWIDQCMTVADVNDFNILFLKFNRKGTFVATPHHGLLQLTNHFDYYHPHHGHWVIMDMDKFFGLNVALVQTLSVPSNTETARV